jgi:glycerate kinase
MATLAAGPGIQGFRLRGLAAELPVHLANLLYTMENAMTSHRPAHKRQTNIRRSSRSMIGAGVGLAALLVAVFAVGMTIGYQSVYRHADVAAVASDTKSPRL